MQFSFVFISGCSEKTCGDVQNQQCYNVLYLILFLQKMMGKKLYKTASQLGIAFLGQIPQTDFLPNSNFKDKCTTKLVNFCSSGKMKYVLE